MLALSATGVLALGLAAPVGAATDSSVTQDVVPGILHASVATLGLDPVTFSHSDQLSNGSMTLTVDDSTDSNAGWDVTIVSSSFTWDPGTTGATGGISIPAANFSVETAATPNVTDGQALDPTNGPKVPAGFAPATLDTAREVLQADPTAGNGVYTQALGVTLTVPGDSTIGTYTGTVTTTITAAP